MTFHRLPKFEGKSFAEPYTPVINAVRGEFGKALLDEYSKVVDTQYNGSDLLKNTLKNFGGGDFVLCGSNPFADVVVNSILSVKGQGGLHIATPADLEKAIRLKREYEDPKISIDLGNTRENQDFRSDYFYDFHDYYVDAGIVLRDKGTYLAKNLANQVGKQQKLKYPWQNPKLPVMIPLDGLEVVNDPKSEYGLSFKLKSYAEIAQAPVLSPPKKELQCETYFHTVNEKTGLPGESRKSKCSHGDRKLITSFHSLCRYILNGTDIDTSNENLQESSPEGRIIVIGPGYY
jgi:hypothetical protein